tara:strand:- start:357 stop:770 length:414 start_codon:yes stop_codon:yes gene_type:complete
MNKYIEKLSSRKKDLQRLEKVNNKKLKKVEFGLVQDLEGYTKSLNAMTKRMLEIEGEVRKIFVELDRLTEQKDNTWDMVRSMGTQGDDQRREGNKIADNIDKVNKELGITARIPQIDAYDKAREDYNEAKNDLFRLF